MEDSIIQIEQLCFEYEENVPVIQDVSFTIEKGSYTIILGHNGSGKSTIAKLLMGLLEASSGKIIIDNLEMNEKNLYDIRSKIGIVFQNPDNQFIGATVRDDIAFGLEILCVPQVELDGIIIEIAKMVDMIDFLDHEPGNLSGGQKQRVAIAGCLAMNPEIMIFDEATSMLDPKGKAEINALIKDLNNDANKTVVSISHDIEEAVYADRIILLDHGKVVRTGKPSEILSDEKLMNQLELDVPFAYKLSKKLEKYGVKACIEKKELEQQLWQLNLKK